MDEQHVAPDQLYALIWAHRHAPPPREGEGADLELARTFEDMKEKLERPLPPEHQLGPDTAARLWAHALECERCRMLVVEDGPGARPPKTEAEKAAEVQHELDERKKKVQRFWTNLPIGAVALGGAMFLLDKHRAKQAEKTGQTGAQMVDPTVKTEIDPLIFGFMALVLVASWFLAEAYVIARELWIDFRAWKRAVPVIGKKWAEKDIYKG